MSEHNGTSSYAAKSATLLRLKHFVSRMLVLVYLPLHAQLRYQNRMGVGAVGVR